MKRLRIHRCLYPLSGRVEQRLGPVLLQLWPPLLPGCKLSCKASSSSSSFFTFSYSLFRSTQVGFWKFEILLLAQELPLAFSVPNLHHFNANSYVPAVFQTCIETHYFCVVLFDEKKLNKMKIATSVRDRMPLHHLCHCLALRFCLSVEVQRWGSTHLWAPVVLYLSSVHG